MASSLTNDPAARIYRSQRIMNEGIMGGRQITDGCRFTPAEKTILATSTVAGGIIGGFAGGPIGALTGIGVGAGVGLGIVALKRSCENER